VNELGRFLPVAGDHQVEPGPVARSLDSKEDRDQERPPLDEVLCDPTPKEHGHWRFRCFSSVEAAVMGA